MEAIFVSSLLAYVLNILICTIIGSIIGQKIQDRYSSAFPTEEMNKQLVSEVRSFLRTYLPLIIVFSSAVSTIAVDYTTWWLFPCTIVGMLIVRLVLAQVMMALKAMDGRKK